MKTSDVLWALVVGVGAYLLWEWWQGNAAPATQTTPSAPIPLVTTVPSGGGPSQVVAVPGSLLGPIPASLQAPGSRLVWNGSAWVATPTTAPIFPSGGAPSQVVAVTTPTLPVQSFNEFGGVPVPALPPGMMYPGGNPSQPIMGGVVNLGSQS
jgi:hypothetical protein